jgi:hypothetical protein
MGADTGEPIEVAPTPDGRIRVAGTVADGARKDQIRGALETLPDHQLIEMQLNSQREMHMAVPALRAVKPSGASIYTVAQAAAPADALLESSFAAHGLSGERLNSAVAQFSREALAHAQMALQNAYALNRLGSAFTESDLQSLSPDARRMWAEMAARHASILENELRALREQLAQIPASANQSQEEPAAIPIRNAADFARAAGQLLGQAQKLNNAAGNAFASGASASAPDRAEALVGEVSRAIPLRGAREMAAFAFRLANAEKTAHTTESGAGHGSLNK